MYDGYMIGAKKKIRQEIYIVQLYQNMEVYSCCCGDQGNLSRSLDDNSAEVLNCLEKTREKDFH